MRVTEQVLVTEVTISGLLADARSWIMWSDPRGKRDHQPAFVACHMPSRLVIAVFVRPRRLHPSEAPAVDWLPVGWLPCVWHPGLSAEIRAWLANPDGREPPGAVTWDGAK